VSDPDYRPEFLVALDLLARASMLMTKAGHPPPILVGGAVVEFETLSRVTSGDLDLVSASDAALDEALRAVGFRREDRPGYRFAAGTIQTCQSPWIASPVATTMVSVTAAVFARSACQVAT
jgi:hypothetical protein